MSWIKSVLFFLVFAIAVIFLFRFFWQDKPERSGPDYDYEFSPADQEPPSYDWDIPREGKG